MLSYSKHALKAMAPKFVKDYLRRRAVETIRSRNLNRPVEDIFREIYLTNKWGGEKGEFCSGSGSTPEHARDYAAAVLDFCQFRGVRTLVDLGCGDFAVGEQLARKGVAYVGVDIVPEVIHRNTVLYASDCVRFECVNAIEDDLPPADLCLIRQVFQHLSNGQIQCVLQKLTHYKYVLVTEHYPSEAVVMQPNLDKPAGEDTRIYDNSAVYLDQSPFNLQSAGLILDVEASRPLVSPGERIRTFLFEMDEGQVAQARVA